MSPSLLKEPSAEAPGAAVSDQDARGAMRLLSVFIRLERLDAVTTALDRLPVGGMTVTDVRGFGRQKGQVEHYRGGTYTIRFVPKVRVDVAVQAEELERVLKAVGDAARTSQVGDGKSFVFELRDAMRIRTGERGIGAL